MNIENEFSPETIECSSEIALNIFRHSERAKREGVPDEKEELTRRGAEMALDKHEAMKFPFVGIEQSVAFGSPRSRAKQTAVFVMGGPDMFEGSESLTELEEKINEGRRYGTKLSTDKRLDFSSGSRSYAEEMDRAYAEKRYLRFLVEESDALAASLHDNAASTFSRHAAGIAEIIKKYITIAPRFDALVKKGKCEQWMERFFGTHQGVGESFLIKVVEKIKGTRARDELLAILGPGFNFVEGYQILIETSEKGGKPTVTLVYQKQDKNGKIVCNIHESLSEELLEEIIHERK